MKKILSLLLALATVMSLSITAFASGTVSMTVAQDENHSAKVGDQLIPGREYLFPLLLTVDGDQNPANNNNLKGYKLSTKQIAGDTSVVSAKVTDRDGQKYLSVIPKASYEGKSHDVRFELVLSKDGNTEWREELAFVVGFPKVADSAISAVENDNRIQVTAAAPVISEEQFETIFDLIGNDPVVFYNGDWEFEVRVPYQETTNFYNDMSRDPIVVKNFPNQELYFFNFPAQPQFSGNGTLTLDVSDYVEDMGEQLYLYRNINNKIMLQKTTYDANAQTLSLQTNQLGNYILTNKEIPHGILISDYVPGNGGSTGNTGNTGSNTDSSGSGAGSSGNAGNNGAAGNADATNPSTGAGNVVALAAAGMVLSLGAMVALKKSR